MIKGYPTADQQTRETIGLRYLLKGLPESQMAVAVGRKSPEMLKEACTILDTYNSLKEETKQPTSVLHSLLETSMLLKATSKSLGKS